ncbi:MAG: transcriptional repressor [candidate division Zixibacteria bacterium]|nr:transcriptional repressor [candidate division Zixibacteria bacterium]
MDRFESLCKTKGLRMTHQRIEVFRELAKYPGHPTVEAVFKKVRRKIKTISLDTVYRTITTFEDLGFIKRIHILDNSARYDTNLTAHHHLICTNCKAIKDFYWPEFDKMKPHKAISGWGRVDIKHVVISGLCSNCKKKR